MVAAADAVADAVVLFFVNDRRERTFIDTDLFINVVVYCLGMQIFQIYHFVIGELFFFSKRACFFPIHKF